LIVHELEEGAEAELIAHLNQLVDANTEAMDRPSTSATVREPGDDAARAETAREITRRFRAEG
jgi:hypothetical protein